MPHLSANDQSKFQTNDATVTPMRKKLQSYGVNFPTKKSSGEKIANETLFPSTPEEEMEQLSMATKLSSMALTSKMSHLLPMTLQQTLLPIPVLQLLSLRRNSSHADTEEAANVLLSLMV